MKSDGEKRLLSNIKHLMEKHAPSNFAQNNVEILDDNNVDYTATPKFFKSANFRFAVIVIGMIILLTFSVAAFATDLFKSDIFDFGIKKAASDGEINDDIITCESSGVKVEITGTVSDKTRTVFEMKIYGLNKTSNEPILLKNVKLTDENGNNYQFNRCGVDFLPAEKAVVNSLEFYGGPGKDTNLYLSFNDIDNVDGEWNFKIPVKYFEEKIYTTNIKYEANDEIWIIDKISIYSSKTVIEGTIESTQDWYFTMELAAEANIFKGFHCVVPDRSFPTRFQYDLEPLNIDGDVKLYIVNLGSQNKDDRYRAVIDIPFDRLQEISPEN